MVDDCSFKNAYRPFFWSKNGLICHFTIGRRCSLVRLDSEAFLECKRGRQQVGRVEASRSTKNNDVKLRAALEVECFVPTLTPKMLLCRYKNLYHICS